jgi:hypothetical protein
VANGGKLFRPRIVSKVESVDGTSVRDYGPELIRTIEIKPDTLTRVRSALADVVKGGTGGMARSPIVDICRQNRHGAGGRDEGRVREKRTAVLFQAVIMPGSLPTRRCKIPKSPSPCSSNMAVMAAMPRRRWRRRSLKNSSSRKNKKLKNSKST